MKNKKQPLLSFEKWWKKNVYPCMERSKYLAKKAYIAGYLNCLKEKEKGDE